MNTMRLRAVAWAVALAVVTQISSPQVRSEVIYDNSTTGGEEYYPALNEYGDEITLGGTSRVINEFVFEYYGDFPEEMAPTARVRFYQNDGGGFFPAPGTVLYDSGEFPIEAGYRHHQLSGIAVDVPNVFTWTVEFSGLAGVEGEQAGLLFRNPPAIGSSFDDFWMRTSNGWALFRTGSAVVANFGARVIAASPQPLSIQRDGSSLILQWSGDLMLHTATQVTGPWQPVDGAVSPFIVQMGTSPNRFWSLLPPASATPSTLSIQTTADQLVLQWGGPEVLQAASAVTGPFTDVVGASSPFAIERETGATLFWRLRQ